MLLHHQSIAEKLVRAQVIQPILSQSYQCAQIMSKTHELTNRKTWPTWKCLAEQVIGGRLLVGSRWDLLSTFFAAHLFSFPRTSMLLSQHLNEVKEAKA